jgi:ketosteroid isomerase-like protein
MDTFEARNIAVVRRYFDGCNSGDLDEFLSTLAPDVVHYFLPKSFLTIRGAMHLAKFWQKYKSLLQSIWRIDEIIGHGDRVVSEWSVLWTPVGKTHQIMSRGTEWYIVRDGLIAEIRAYFGTERSVEIDTELADFPYSERGYLTREGA